MSETDKITVTLPDGTKQAFPRGVTTLQVAESIGPRLAQDALAGKVNGRVVDVYIPIQEDADVELMQQDWYNHEARRIFVADSFDFRIETLGVFTNRDLVRKACAILGAKLEKMMNAAQGGALPIAATLSTMPNAFDLTLEGEGYTLGKLLEAILHKEAYKKQKALSYVGFRKSHPHDTNSTIRVALSNKSEGGEGTVRTLVAAACGTGLRIMHEIEQAF